MPTQAPLHLSSVRSRRMRPAFGTFCVIDASGPDPHIDSIVCRAFEVMTEIERRMHPTRVGSDLARIGRTRAAIEIHATTWRVLSLAKEICELSRGVFDPCLPQARGRLDDVELRENSTVICHAPVAIDLGGIAKGFAIDQAVDVLLNEGCGEGIVNAGGDLRVFGPQPQELFLRAKMGGLYPVTIQDAALAVTKIETNNAPPEHRGYYSRLEQRSVVRQRAAIVAKRAAIADALTKCALFCSTAELATLTLHYGARLLDE